MDSDSDSEVFQKRGKSEKSTEKVVKNEAKVVPSLSRSKIVGNFSIEWESLLENEPATKKTYPNSDQAKKKSSKASVKKQQQTKARKDGRNGEQSGQHTIFPTRFEMADRKSLELSANSILKYSKLASVQVRNKIGSGEGNFAVNKRTQEKEKTGTQKPTDLVVHASQQLKKAKPVKRSYPDQQSDIAKKQKHDPAKPRADIRIPDEKRKFPCHTCNKKFITGQQLNNHINEVHKKIRHFCECGQDFSNNRNLKRHMKEQHGEAESFPCSYDDCFITFTQRGSLTRHVQEVHLKRKFICEHCKEGFTKRDYLYKHVKIQHENYTYECEKCPSVYRSKGGIQYHELTAHYKGKIYKCDCSKVFKEPASLARHQERHKNDKQETCDICKQSFLGKRRLGIHKASIHNGYKTQGRTCGVCNAEVPNYPSLLFHLHCNHDGKDMNLNLDNTCVYTQKEEDEFIKLRQENDFMCCGIKYRNENALRIHITLCHKRISWWGNLIQRKFEQIGSNETEVREKMLEMYDLAKSYQREIDLNRKLYLIVFVPKEVTEDKLESYLAEPTNKFLFYWGKRTLDGRFDIISAHHLNTTCKVSTHYITELRCMNAYHIADIPLSPECEQTKGLETIAYLEAKQILTLFLFCLIHKQYRIFQTLELHPLSKISLEDVRDIFNDVEKSGGDWSQLQNTRMDFVRWIKIPTEHITIEDMTPYKCNSCTFQGVSKLDLSVHQLRSHPDDMNGATPTERLLKLVMTKELNPNSVHKILREKTTDNSYHVYVVLKARKDMKPTLNAYRKSEKAEQESYVGKQSYGNGVSYYHFENGTPSTVKNMKEAGFNLIHLLNYKCKSMMDMEKLEFAQILIGFIRREAKLGVGPLLRNRCWTIKHLPFRFKREEIKEIVEFSFSGKDQFLENNLSFVPKPVSVGTILDIPSIAQMNPNEAEVDATETDEMIDVIEDELCMMANDE